MARLSRFGLSAWTVLVAVALVATALTLTLASVRGGSAATPSESLTTPEGTVINVYTIRVHAADVYQSLLANGLQSWIGLARVDVVETGLTMSSVGGGTSTASDGSVSYFASPAAIQINANDYLAHPNYTVGHEYGHVWANYYVWTYWKNSWSAYLTARGVAGDPRLNSGGCWYVAEMIGDDYRQLFAAPETTPGVLVINCNTDIPPASTVAGLRDFLGMTWTNGHLPPGYASGPAPTPTATSVPPMATPTPMRTTVPPPSTSTTVAPTFTPTRTPVPATSTAVPPTSTPTSSPPPPTATPVPPSGTATPGPSVASVTLNFLKGWSSFVAPVSGSTSRAVYTSSGKKAVAVYHVTVGVTYWVKGPVTITITPP